MECPENEMLMGQAKIRRCIFGFVDGLALKCVVELGIPDIINSHGSPLSLSSIVRTINNPSLDIDRLSRVMALLVHRGIFNAISPVESSNTNDTLYQLTNSSKYLLRNSKPSLAPVLLLHHHQKFQSAWQNLPDIVKNGSSQGGSNVWDFASADPEFSNIFNEAMVGSSKMVVDAFLANYKDKFNGIGSIVDVAGGTVPLVSEIVKARPHIKGINFDLPHVVAEAPAYDGLTHVSGDMFVKIPSADAIVLKRVLHNWNDENCIKILKNCQKALPEMGRVIILDVVLCHGGEGPFHESTLIADLTMMVHFNAKERNETEWKKLLEEAGFATYNIIKIPAQQSIIEAFLK